jgi:UDP-GlcNAc:undecaprenyl-phosphate/decaprenyl-phosphate GlcNAc-1-phosphate transferase
VSEAWALVAAVAAGATAAAFGALVVRSAPEALVVTNRSGRRVPATLGWALVGGAVIGLLAVRLLWSTAPAAASPTLLFSGAALVVVLAAGLIDDLGGHHARGFGGHLGSLVKGRVTTGILKLIVGVVVGVWLAVWVGGGAARVAAAAVLIVVSINLWNALDVVPGRALKLAIPVLATVMAAGLDQPAGAVAGTGLGASAALLPLDLRERGMLGDAGSNPLGLLTGLGLALLLPTWGVVIAAAVALVLQVVAETVTISRLIDFVAPVRWFDRLGRRTM